jgi:lactoylglutathione lyase
MIKGIAHLGFLVQDLEKSIDFYVNKLGFKEKFTLNNDKGQPWIVYIEVSNSQLIELFPSEAPIDKRTEYSSYQHLCLEVENIHGLVRELKLKDVEIDQPIIMGLDHNYQSWIHDPDGNPIELMEYGKDSLQLKK